MHNLSGASQCRLTLHFGARAPASALMALSALLSSTKLMVAFSSSRPTICTGQHAGAAGRPRLWSDHSVSAHAGWHLCHVLC